MTTTNPQSDDHPPTEFERQRAALVADIGDSLEGVLTQLNSLNRSLEGIIEIGNEFASVEALWSQFETVMGNQEAPLEDDAGATTAEEAELQQQRGDTDGGK